MPHFVPLQERRCEAQLSNLTLHEGLAAAARRLAQRQRVGERQAMFVVVCGAGGAVGGAEDFGNPVKSSGIHGI